MVTQLQIGRVGAETDLGHPFGFSDASPQNGGRTLSIRGHIKDTTDLATAKYLRDEFIYQARSPLQSGLVAVTSLTDPYYDGYYILEGTSLELTHDLGSLQSTGFIPFTASLTKVETIMFASGLTGGVLPNDHAVSSGDPFLAPPGSATTFTPDTGAVRQRPSAEGTIRSYYSIDENDTPFWSVHPADYYKGAVKLRVGSPLLLRSGYTVPDDPDNWQLDNGHIRLTGNSSGEFTIEINDGTTWQSSTAFELLEGGTAVGAWDHITVIRNEPHEVSIRLIQTRTGVTRGRITLDIQLRRGSVFATFFHTTTASADLKIQRTTTDAATTFSPWGVHDAANDGDGNRWVLGTRETHTADTTNGGITKTAATTFDYFVGIELDGSSAVAKDTASDMGDQYIHTITERVSPVVAQAIPL